MFNTTALGSESIANKSTSCTYVVSSFTIKAHTTVTLTLIAIFGNTALWCCGCKCLQQKQTTQLEKKICISNPYKSEKEQNRKKDQYSESTCQKSNDLLTHTYIHFLLGTAAN